MNSGEQQKSSNIETWHQAAFLNSSMPMLLFDVSDVGKKCKELEGFEIIDIDRYLAAELFFKKYSASYIQMVAVNKAALSLFQVYEDRELSSGKSKIYSQLHAKISNEIVGNIFRKCVSSEYEFEVKENGILKYISVIMDIFISDGNEYSLITLKDISKKKQFDRISTEYIEKYYLLLKAVDEAILIVDVSSGMILEANNISIELFGKDIKGILGQHHSYFFHNENKNQYNNFFNEKIIGDDCESSINTFILKGNKVKIPVKIEINTASVGGKKVAQIIFYDMSNRFKMEEGRRLLATAVDQAAESVIITDIFGNIQYVNPAFENISGYSYTEVLGKNPRILKSDESPNYQYKLMWQEISNGNVWRGVFKNKKKNGTIYTEEATITPVKDNDGKIINYVAVKRDVTHHLILENQIRQSQKMQAIGALAGGVAHDFNNILTAILGYAELSQARCQPDSLLHNNMEEIIRAADRAAQLVDQILKFSRQGEKNVASLQMSLIVKEVLKLIRASLPANIELVSDIMQDAYVKADPTQIHQIVMNLCTNAYQALEGRGGIIHIRLYTKDLSPKEGVEVGNLQHGTYVCLQVQDNGVGIAQEYLQRIFDPYFTTKKINEGTGLGLSVVHGIVNDHRGAVSVESTPNIGTCFTVFLPKAEKESGVDKREHQTLNAHKAGRILVVDDEQPIVFFLVQVLEHLGYTVDSCLSSETACQKFLAENGEYDLVITDMGMPGMTGLELAEELKKICPEVPIMICTGFSEQVTADNYQNMGLAGFVSKPFSAEHLSKEVHRILAPKSSF
jgi:PAS domain S-box-containing protein